MLVYRIPLLVVLVALGCDAPAEVGAARAEMLSSQGPGASEVDAARFGVHEIVLTTGRGGVSNPFDTNLRVTFTPPSGTAVTVDGFYDGGDTWRARVYVTETGDWSWATASTDDSGLRDQSGTFTAVASTLRGKMRKHPDNVQQWATDDGRTFLNLADTPYGLFNDEYSEDLFRRYVNGVANRGISLLRVGYGGGYSGWGPGVRACAGEYPRSNWIHEGMNLGRLDLSQLQKSEERLAWLLANRPDVYVDLHLLPKTDDIGRRWYGDFSAADRERTLRNLVARLAAWPNILFLIQRDVPHTYNSSAENLRMSREIGAYLLANDPWDTLRGSNEKSREMNLFTEESDFDGWESYLEVQAWGYPDGSAVEHYYDTFAPVPVHVFHGEDRYDHPEMAVVSDPAYYYRRLFWSALISGGSGAYGSKYKAIIPYDESADTVYCGESGPRELRGLDDTAHIVTFFDRYRIDLARFTPDDGIARQGDAAMPEGDGGPSRVKATRDGTLRLLLYHPNVADGERSSPDIRHNGVDFPVGDPSAWARVESRLTSSPNATRTPSLEVDLSAASGTTYRVTWFHPGTGESYEEGTVDGGDWVTLSAPSAFEGSDAVLLLVDEAAPVAPDAGTDAAVPGEDGGPDADARVPAGDGGIPPGEMPTAGGCGCGATGTPAYSLAWLPLLLLLCGFAKRRRRSG